MCDASTRCETSIPYLGANVRFVANVVGSSGVMEGRIRRSGAIFFMEICLTKASIFILKLMRVFIKGHSDNICGVVIL